MPDDTKPLPEPMSTLRSFTICCPWATLRWFERFAQNSIACLCRKIDIICEKINKLVWLCHYDDVIMTMLASQITSLTVVYSIVYSGVNQRKHQSSASLAFVCAGNSPGTGEFPAQMASYAENVSIWWRHHVHQLTSKNKTFLDFRRTGSLLGDAPISGIFSSQGVSHVWGCDVFDVVILKKLLNKQTIRR